MVFQEVSHVLATLAIQVMVKRLELVVSMITSVPMVQILALQMLLAQIPLVSLDFDLSFSYYTKVLVFHGFIREL